MGGFVHRTASASATRSAAVERLQLRPRVTLRMTEDSGAPLPAEGVHFRDLAQRALAGMYVIQEGRLVYANPALDRMFGYEAGELVGTDPLVVIHADDRARVADNMRRRGTGATVTPQYTFRGVRKDGTVRHFEVLSTSMMLGGRPALQGTVVDVTDRVQAEDALRASESRFRTLIDHAPVAIGISRAGTTVWANAAYLHLFGFESDEGLVGHSLGEQIAPEVSEEIVKRNRRRLQGLAVPSGYETIGLRHDGSRFPMYAAVTEVDLPDGPAALAFLTDITELRRAEADLALEATVRAALTEALYRLSGADTVERIAQAVCDALWTLPQVDFVAVFGFSFGDQIKALAHRAPDGFPPAHSKPSARSRRMHEHALGGPYAAYWQSAPEDGTWGSALSAMGLRASAYGPIVHGDHVDGMLMLGTCNEAFARTLVERLPAVVDFATTPSALLAERLHERRDYIETRALLERQIDERGFAPVYQPIVELATGDVVGYEALTRFSSGQRPDLCFADAWRVGIGPELELATLQAAINQARQLPAGRWLDLNLSPRLLAEPERLRAVLHGADRPIVLEITEHEVIEDYGAVKASIRSLGHDIRLAVDDAGAGIANFGHIIELHPDLVKLDISLVRRVNANLGRQALVTAMRHFARTTGCRLVAEGIETQEEANTLQAMGVEFGQGYLLGRPEPVEMWAEDGATGVA